MDSASTKVLEWVAGAEDAGERFDRFLAVRLPGFSRQKIQAAIRSGHATLAGADAVPSKPIREGVHVTWSEPPLEAVESATAEDLPLNILFEDEAMLVLDKAAGMVVHPGAGNHGGTLVSALLHHCANLSSSNPARPGIVHRLDKETSGCLLVAKTDSAHMALAGQFARREVTKVYLALVEGAPRRPFGVVDAPIGRHVVHRKKMAVVENGRGRDAVTEFRILERGERRSLVECRPRTGRTHQIRVHLKHLGCPVAGDPLYGNRNGLTRHMLHAWKISFRHPLSGDLLHFEAKPPADFVVRS